jgi:hypothetical protein
MKFKGTVAVECSSSSSGGGGGIYLVMKRWLASRSRSNKCNKSSNAF